MVAYLQIEKYFIFEAYYQLQYSTSHTPQSEIYCSTSIQQITMKKGISKYIRRAALSMAAYSSSDVNPVDVVAELVRSE